MIAAIVAMTEDGVIGKQNGLPWRLSADLQRVKKLTMGHTLIMGRKTADSIVDRIGKALPGRRSIVITRGGDYNHEGFESVSTIEQALELAEDDIFIFGGAQIYELAMPYVERIYMTVVHAAVDGDVYFPKFDLTEWQQINIERHKKDEYNEYDYDFVELERLK